MSNSRKVKAKYQNSTFFRYQQRNLHVAQKRAGLLDNNNRKFKFIPRPANMSNFAFWIFFVSFLQYSIGRAQLANSEVKVDNNVRELALSRIKILDGLDHDKCSVIVDRIGALAAINSDFRVNALNVLSQSNFELDCTNLSALKNNAMNENARGGFVVKTNSMTLAIDSIYDCILTHEIWHARMAQLHNAASNCYITNDNIHGLQSVPIYPINDENIKAFETCMSKGDNRIRELHRILAKSYTKVPLSQEEKYQLGRAKKALKGVLLNVGELRTSKGILNDLRKLGWPAKKAIIIDLEANIYALNVIEHANEIFIEGEAETGIDAALHSINKFSLLKRRGFKNKLIEISERIAYSLQQLDIESRHFLYPELSELLTQEQAKCLRHGRSEL